MRILLTIHHHLDRDSGAPGVTVRLAEQYVAAGHRADILSFDDMPQHLPEELRPLLFPCFVAARIRHLMSTGPYDVIDASSGDSALVGNSARRSPRALLVVRSHGLEHVADEQLRAEAAAGRVTLSWRYPIYHAGYRLREVARAMRRADINIVLNRADEQFAVHRLGLDPDTVRVVANGVPESMVAADRDRRSGVSGGDQCARIVQIGSYIQRKGIAYGNAALRTLLRDHPALSATFLGTGCSPDRVLGDFDQPLRARITVIPRYRNEDLATLLRPDDINIFPTLAEGFPVALLEAMAHGLPSVVTATPGPLELARDGVNALVVPARDSRALVEATKRLLQSDVLRSCLSTGALATARGHTWTRIADVNLGIYQQGIAVKRGAESFESQPRSRPAPSGAGEAARQSREARRTMTEDDQALWTTRRGLTAMNEWEF